MKALHLTTISSVLFSILPVLAACGQSARSTPKAAWNSANNPLKLADNYERTLDSLPLSGELTKTPWSDTYWPSYLGGLANRWNTDKPDGFKYATANKNTVAQMSLADLAQLSPAEKFDIYTGNFNYPLLKAERGRTSPHNETWEGICHGWSPAAINFDEPKPIVAVGSSNIKVPFGSGDIKALLDLYQGNYANLESRFLAARCDTDLAKHPEAASQPECQGVNPGAFHIVLTNFIGKRDTGFVANVYRSAQIWNQPVHGFSTKITGHHLPSPGAAVGTTDEADVETTMIYTQEGDPTWDTVLGTDNQNNTSAVYKYRLELNEQGEIIGGAWLQDDRPSFLWTQERPNFTGKFAALADLYEASQTGPAVSNPFTPAN